MNAITFKSIIWVLIISFYHRIFYANVMQLYWYALMMPCGYTKWYKYKPSIKEISCSWYAQLSTKYAKLSLTKFTWFTKKTIYSASLIVFQNTLLNVLFFFLFESALFNLSCTEMLFICFRYNFRNTGGHCY